MAIENVRHPIKDTVKADNSTYSSNKIESLIHSATELPATSVEDIGKVVTVVSDGDEGAEYGLENAPAEVPTPTAEDKNKVISVNNSGEYVLTPPFSVSLLPGMIQNGATLSPINLPKTAGSFNANGIILALVDTGNSNNSIYFRKSYETSGPSGITTFSAITYESSKVYYHELKIGYKATSIPAGTTVSKIEIG